MGTDQDEVGHQRQFNAAVSVIQSLPKNGSYRPSYEEMLRFYSYYKQATAGPCNIPRPGFWDPIGRYKWDAWNRLGRMSQDDAMCAYIKEMKTVAQKIIDTVPLEDTSPEMFEPFRPLYEVIPDMPRPPASFFKSSSDEDAHRDVENRVLKEETEGLQDAAIQHSDEIHKDASQTQQIPQFSHPGQAGAERRRDPVGEASYAPQEKLSREQRWGHNQEDSSDSLEQVESDKDCEDEDSWVHPHLFQPASDVTPISSNMQGGRQQEGLLRDPHCGSETVSHSATEAWLVNPRNSSRAYSSQHQLSPQITATVEALQKSIQVLCQRLEGLEKALQDQQLSERQYRSYKKSRFSLRAPSRTLLFIIVWPFIVHWLLHRFYRRKR
ncbi:acyl-CoA-binding domain-containing protein 4 [Rhinophrynus dorsalis]